MKNYKTETTNTKTYNTFLSELKEQIKTSQTRAIGSVNFEMLILYFKVGKALEKKQKDEGWGTKVIERLSIDLQSELPKVKGFSRRNMMLMVQFYKEYRDIEIVQLPVAQLKNTDNKQFLIIKISWSHNVALIQKIKDKELRYWYMQRTIEEGWGRDTLIAKIKQEVHKKEGKLISNFKAILPLSLCQEKDEIVAEYSLRNMSQPIGISEYELTEVLPKEFLSSLPTIEMIESEFSKIEDKK